MALSDVAIRNAKPRDKPYKMGDAGGLFLLVQPSGGKLWRLKFRVAGKEKKLALGTYPEVSLGEARRRRDDARELIAAGKDPTLEKKRTKARSLADAENTFSAIAAEFCEKRKRDGIKGWSPATAVRSEHLLALLKPSIGSMAIAEIEPADILEAVRRIERKGQLESARRTLQLAGSVFRYAIATTRLRSDPTRDLRGALTAPTVTHYGALTDPKRVGEAQRARVSCACSCPHLPPGQGAQIADCREDQARSEIEIAFYGGNAWQIGIMDRKGGYAFFVARTDRYAMRQTNP